MAEPTGSIHRNEGTPSPFVLSLVVEHAAARATPPAAPIQPRRELSTVCSSPIYARALARLIESEPTLPRHGIWCESDLTRPGPVLGSGVLLVAPQDGAKLGPWLPGLRMHAASLPWVMLAELRWLGMFLSPIDGQPCLVVHRSASPAVLKAAVRAAAENRCSYLPAELLAHFARGASLTPDGRRTRQPSVIELQCACGVSLGLTNQQIAERLQLREGTIKSHLYRLMRKLGLSNRSELGILIERVFAPACNLYD